MIVKFWVQPNPLGGGIVQIDSGTERLVVWARAHSPPERGRVR